ncbi:MAG: ATP-binding cassette domain-containing protein [Acidobacteriota bacterium]|nr:ATP-binding cassette domain-containing protein [Acidobacteriota bacterium]
MSFIAYEDVSVVFPATGKKEAVTALEDIHLQLEPTELVVVIGRSGCGKTTLLNLLAGFMSPSKGRVLMDGLPIVGPGVERGAVFQKNALMPWFNVRKNVELGLIFQKISAEARKARVEECLAWVGLEEFANHRVYELSGGMQQRVGIARALAGDPRILLMDEPLGALDALTRETLQELVLDIWNKSHKLILLITHSIEEALFMGTKLVVMTPRPGRIHKVYPLDFCQKFIAGDDARAIKSSPEFIALREEIMGVIHPKEGGAL